MAVDFGSSGNTDKYYSTPDSDDLALPGSDWSVAVLVYIEDTTANKYFISTGELGAIGEFNLFVYADGGFGFACKYSNYGDFSWGNGNVTPNKWYWVYAARRSNNMYVGAAEFDTGGTPIEIEGGPRPITATSSLNSTNALNIGRRNSTPPANYMQGRIDRMFYSHTYGMDLDDARELAGGVLPADCTFSADIAERVNFVDSAGATITGVGDGNVFTKQGTGYGVNTASPYGSAETKGLRITLPVTSLTDIEVAVFDETTLGTLAAPITKTNSETIDGSGLLEIDIDSDTAQDVTDTCLVMVRDPDGADIKDSLVHLGPHPIVDIA